MNHPWREITKLLSDIQILEHLRGQARKHGTNYVLFEPNKLFDELGIPIETRRQARIDYEHKHR